MGKVCGSCREQKLLCFFYKNRFKKDGYQNYCKECMKKTNARSFQRHKKKRMKRSLQYAKTAAGRQYRRNYAKKKYHNDVEYRSKVIARSVSYEKKRLSEDSEFRLQHNLRTNFRKFLHGGVKTKRVVELLKCSWDELKKHLESKFLPGMTFENYGEWHVDHIIPCKAFSVDEQHYCWWYMNLQPLWAKDNAEKGASYDESDKKALIERFQRSLSTR